MSGIGLGYLIVREAQVSALCLALLGDEDTVQKVENAIFGTSQWAY